VINAQSPQIRADTSFVDRKRPRAATNLIARPVAKKLNELVITHRPAMPRHAGRTREVSSGCCSRLRGDSRSCGEMLLELGNRGPAECIAHCGNTSIRHLSRGFTELMKLLGEIEGGHLHAWHLKPEWASDQAGLLRMHLMLQPMGGRLRMHPVQRGQQPLKGGRRSRPSGVWRCQGRLASADP